MNMQFFRGVKDIKDLTAALYNGVWYQLQSWWNDHNSGVRAWDNLVATKATITTLTNAIMSYRRPVLQYSSGTVVNMETGINGTSGQLQILFPDGTVATDSTGSHFNIDLTRVASSTQSGLRTGSLANNTWYACYATKNGSNIIGVADTVLPLQANFSTLNSNFGTNSWVYLGMIANGDNASSPSGILKFTMSGNQTIFRNANVGGVVSFRGILLANLSVAAASLTWSYATGTAIASAQVPNHLLIGDFVFCIGGGGSGWTTADSGGGATYIADGPWTIGQPAFRFHGNLTDGAGIFNVSVNNTATIGLAAFVDHVLGVGGNPLL